jgi:two-component system response regulator YesN
VRFARLKKLKNISLFYKYLISYALLLILPVIVIGLFVNHFIVSTLQTQVQQTNRAMLEQVRDTMDGQLAEMRNIAIQLSVQREFDPERLSSNYSIYEAKDKISLYAEANAFFSEVVYKARNQDMLISSKSTYLSVVFYNMFLSQHLTYDQYLRLLESDVPTVNAANASQSLEPYLSDRYLSYAIPVPAFGSTSKNKGTLLFLIKEKKVKQMFSSFLPYRKSNVYLIDGQGQLVASLVDTGSVPDGLLDVKSESSEIRKLDGDQYYVSKVISTSSGWTYVTVVSETELMKPIEQMQLKAGIALALILVVGSSIIYINMNVHYHPLRKLIDVVDSKLHPANVKSPSGGLEKLRSAFDYMSDRSHTLESQIERGRPAMRQQLLNQLLSGQIREWSEFKELGTPLGITLQTDQYRVVCLQAHQGAELSLIREQLPALWRSVVPHFIELYSIDTIQPEQWIWIQSCPPESGGGESWNEWHQKLKESTGLTWTIGVGEAVEALTLLPKSYISATTALQYRLILGNDRVILPHQLNQEHQKLPVYSAQQFQTLPMLLRDHDTDKVKQHIKQLLEHIHSSSSSLLSAKYIYFDLINTQVKAAAEAGAERGMSVEYPDVIALTSCTSYQQMDEIVWNTFEQIRPLLMKEAPVEQDRILLQEMIELLQEKYADPQFSIQSMSSYFSQSISSLSRYFKEQTGQTISEHLHAIRINKAKRLLIDTDLSIAIIVQKIGYSDPSSFIRKFKTEVQLTPGEYRKRLQQNEDKK